MLTVLLVGCVQEDVQGSTRTYTYQLWLPVSILLGGVVAVPAGWFLRKTSSRMGWGLLIGGPIAAIVFAPSFFRDRAVVDDTTFSLRAGIWGFTAAQEVPFRDLQGIRIVFEEVRGRRGSRRTKYYMLCERSDGTTAKVPLSNKIVQAALPYFLSKVADLGIPVVDET